MFTRKTVFVVGAGASVEVGLPPGSVLKTAIAKKLAVNESGFVDEGIRQAVAVLIEKSRNTISWALYQDAAIKIARAMPASLSIDNFLHTHANDEKLVTMGKLSIAACILDAERKSTLRSGQAKSVIENAEKYWANTFCKILTEQVQVDNLEDLFANVTIITFNYDRCIEFYVAQYLTTYFLLKSSDANALAQKLTVLHPYGQVGQLPWNGRSEFLPIDFGSAIHPGQLVECVDQIYTFTEQRTEPKVIQKVHQAVSTASCIVFLGFAYHDLNMAILTPDVISNPKIIYGTAFGISDKNVARIHVSVRNAMSHAIAGSPEFDMSEPNVGCNQFLEDYWRPIFN